MSAKTSTRPNGVNGSVASVKGQLDASKLKFDLTTALKDIPKPGSAELWEQNVATDHMVTCRWTVQNGWDDPVIKPFGDLTISPLASCLHYATQCFEGMKVYRGYDDRVRLFRPDRNARRLVMSAERVSLPSFDPEQLVELIKALVRVDGKRWLSEPGSFRYIRPALIGTGRQLGIQIPKEAILMVTMVCWPDFSTESPPGVDPRSDLRLITSRNDTIRAWPGGFGYAKVGANYGPSFASHCEAQQAGYDQVLWLLGDEGLVTEAGASNFFAVVRDEETSKSVLLTAPLTDRVILDGVTRRSVLDLVQKRLSEELEVREAKFTIKDIEAAWRKGLLQEAFVSGTAFFIKNVSTIRVGDFNVDLPQKQDDGSGFGPRIKSWLKDIMFGGEDHEWDDSLLNGFENALEHALQATIRQHTGLQYGISDEKEAGVPLFRQISTFDRQDILEVIDNQYAKAHDQEAVDVNDDGLSKSLQNGHSELWPENKPAWKVVVIKHPSDFISGVLLRLHIAFFAHHAIADGLSGVVFHASLMNNLKLDTSTPTLWPLELNEVQDPPPTIEERVDCLSCNCAICTTPDQSDEPVWGGGPIPAAPTVDYESRVRIVTVPAAPFSSLLKKCKQSNITVTGLLHAIICSSLNNSVEEGIPGFRAVTPFSARRHTGASDGDIVNHISYLTSYVSREELQKIKAYKQGSTTGEERVIDLARQFSNEVATKAKEFPHGSMATKLSQVRDIIKECQSQGDHDDSMAPETRSEPLREWIILIPDNKDSLETRMRVRESHIKDMLKHIDSGLFQMGGGTLAGDSVGGSAIIARAKSEADVLAVLKNDVYARSGVWDLENIKFIPGKGLTQGTVTLPLLKEHQVYVKVEYAAFNPTDRLALDVNAFGDGAVLGCDFAGKVVEAHSTVTKLKPGDSIAGFVWGGEIKGLGAYSLYTIADERLSFKIPENINPAEASSVPLAANTAWLALFSDDCLAIGPEKTASKTPLLIWGGNTTVGYFAIQIAKLYNIEVATTCSPRNFDKMRQAGATHVFDYNDEEVVSKIQSAVPNLQHVFDTVGNETSSATAAKSISQPEGVLCTVRPGRANTQDVPSHIKVTDVFVFTAFPTEHSYRGKAHWPVKMNDHKLSADFHGQLETLLGNGSLRPAPIRLIGQLSLSTVEKAMDLNRQGSISGEKLVFEGLT
ncbi:branched-chain amino acid aminotransferase [Fusarium circinatum]|uniref:Branched-chain-amino-acid aminotransferase n=1 Tax=Fusarium circinatum TaxID=48490 RepID=A0A8H5SXT9_FUSCI|nr:branched-chain amino acid aminotransferase [Fusarium circinatum]